jgi:hypothetical protein
LILLFLLLHLSLLGNHIGDDLGRFAARYEVTCYPEGSDAKVCAANMHPDSPVPEESTWLRAEFSADDKLQSLTVYLKGDHKDAMKWVSGFTKSYGPPESEFVVPPNISKFWQIGGQFLAIRYTDKFTSGIGHDIITLSLSTKKIQVAE